MTKPSLKITYFAVATGPTSIDKPDGIDEFQRELDGEYLTAVHGRPGPLGGLYQLTVEFVTNLTLKDVASFLAAGVAYDLMKSGSKQLLLRPFLNAYDKLKNRNANHRVGIDRLTFNFGDAILVIDVSYPGVISDQLGPLFESLASNYPHFILSSGEVPFQIYVPVFEDDAPDRICRFRELLEVDEVLAKRTSVDYFGYWGLWYDFSSEFRVYDVQQRLLLNEEFLPRDLYWRQMEEKWRREREARTTK